MHVLKILAHPHKIFSGYVPELKNKGWQCLRGKYSGKSKWYTSMLRQMN